MFGVKGKQYGALVANHVESMLGEHLSKQGNNKTKNETPTEQLGQVTGKRKALFIGINYTGQGGELRGCINDVKNIRAFLEGTYHLDDVRVLTDDQSDPNGIPTRANILKGFQWLRANAAPGDSLILHYSGHGGSQKDTDGDEEDGMDETLCPVDYASAGIIVDDEVHDVLVRGLPKGVRMTAIMDCCHSESMLDLPYTYSVTGDLEIVENNRAKGISKLVATGVRYILDGNKKVAMRSLTQGFKQLMNGDGAQEGDAAARQKTIDTRSTEADVVSFSGCKDNQTSADANIGGEATGAMTYALIASLKESKTMEYTDLLRTMRQKLDGKYTQVPMMSAGRKLDLTSTFSF